MSHMKSQRKHKRGWGGKIISTPTDGEGFLGFKAKEEIAKMTDI